MPATRIFKEHGETVRFEHDDLSKKVTVKRTVDVGLILENNKRLATMDDGYSPSRTMRRVANIPNAVLENWCCEDGINLRHFMQHHRQYSKWLRKKIYDSENRFVLAAPHVAKSKTYNPGLSEAISSGRRLGRVGSRPNPKE